MKYRCRIFGHKLDTGIKKKAIGNSERHIVRCVLDDSYFGRCEDIDTHCIRCEAPISVSGDYISRSVVIKEKLIE